MLERRDLKKSERQRQKNILARYQTGDRFGNVTELRLSSRTETVGLQVQMLEKFHLEHRYWESYELIERRLESTKIERVAEPLGKSDDLIARHVEMRETRTTPDVIVVAAVADRHVKLTRRQNIDPIRRYVERLERFDLEEIKRKKFQFIMRDVDRF